MAEIDPSERVLRPGFRNRVYDRVRDVPSGRVTTYGAVAASLGHPRVARQVGYALAALPTDTDVPWHRVINAKGCISHRGEVDRPSLQRLLLEAEGVVFGPTEAVDLRVFGFRFSPDGTTAAD